MNAAAASVHRLRGDLGHVEPGSENGNGRPKPQPSEERVAEIAEATRDLNELLELPDHKAITGARILGDGADAAIFMELADGSEMHLTARDMARPAALLTALAVGPGVRPKLNQARALDAVVLVKTLARHVRTMSETDQAIEWGVNFLQMADVIDVDLYDQGERWGAFSMLKDQDPRARHRETNVSIATASKVLRHRDGSRLVRTDWLVAYVRSIEPRITPAHLAILMQNAGWRRRGKEGRWKATPPGRPGQLNWAFWLVAPDWESRGETVVADATVTAGYVIPPARTRARVGAVTSRNQDTAA